MSVQVTITVSDEDAETLRRNPHMYFGDAMNVTYRVCGLVREALPAPPLEPKAGGTCRARGNHWAAGVREILHADSEFVIFRGVGSGPSWVQTWPSTLTAEEFARDFEVLS